MSPRTVSIIRPGGQSRAVSLRTQAAGESLALTLEAAGFPLNMRCGGRGLCRGCQVVLKGTEGTREIQSCQSSLAAIEDAFVSIQIPENSWRDHSLHGVSVFEIRLHTDIQPKLKKGYGLALDIGTTTIAGALWDFSTGQCAGTLSIANTQARFGDNVLSRISYTLENENGTHALQSALVQGSIQPLIQSLCQSAGIDPDTIVEATAAGNPMMLHSLAGVSLAGLSRYPFRPEFIEALTLNSTDIGLKEDFPIKLLPSLGPFVGADIAAGALAAGIMDEQGPVLLIDFGTNGEILLKHKSGYLATATAAGPAFEGGRLSCGATARSGVISSLHRENKIWKWNLIGNEDISPSGISGAAYIDFLAIGIRDGFIRESGRFVPEAEGISLAELPDGPERRITFTPDTYISEVDIAELQQAKAAIGGGILTLLEQANLTPADLHKVYVAGGFGYHLNPENAIAIGLLPNVPLERIEIVGNASLGGASLILCNSHFGHLDELRATCRIIELNQAETFEDHFTDSLLLAPCE